jgi:hypothetical protein
MDAEQMQMQLRLLRDKSPSERLGLALRLASDVIRASKCAISRVHLWLYQCRRLITLRRQVARTLSRAAQEHAWRRR